MTGPGQTWESHEKSPGDFSISGALYSIEGSHFLLGGLDARQAAALAPEAVITDLMERAGLRSDDLPSLDGQLPEHSADTIQRTQFLKADPWPARPQGYSDPEETIRTSGPGSRNGYYDPVLDVTIYNKGGERVYAEQSSLNGIGFLPDGTKIQGDKTNSIEERIYNIISEKASGSISNSEATAELRKLAHEKAITEYPNSIYSQVAAESSLLEEYSSRSSDYYAIEDRTNEFVQVQQAFNRLNTSTKPYHLGITEKLQILTETLSRVEAEYQDHALYQVGQRIADRASIMQTLTHEVDSLFNCRGELIQAFNSAEKNGVTFAAQRGIIQNNEASREAPRPLVTGSYKDLRRAARMSAGQVHHLNQTAAFRVLISRNSGISILLYGNVFKDVGSPHRIIHENLEGFWDSFRIGGSQYGRTPLLFEYNAVVYSSALSAGFSTAQALEIVHLARAEQLHVGLTETTEVPKIPRKIHLKKQRPHEGG